MGKVSCRGLLAGSVLALALTLGPAAAADPVDGKAGLTRGQGTLTIGNDDFPDNFHPNIQQQATKTYMQWLAYRPMTTFDENWELICLLCTELPTYENGRAWAEALPDGSPGIKVKFTIQPGATWGDGTPVSARDAVYTWEVGRTAESGFSNVRFYTQDIVKVEAVDDKTFVMHRKFSCDYNNINDFRLLPEHVDGPYFRANPAEYVKRNAYDDNPLNPGLWFGPYRPVKMMRGSYVIFEPNPTWYGPKPAFDQIVMKAVENTTALEQTLLAGGVDYVPGETGFGVTQGAAFERRHGARYNIVWKNSLYYFHMDVNHDNPILADRRVRQALMYGMDRSQIVDVLFYGKGAIADTQINPLNKTFHDGVYRYTYDPEKAAALLEQAGWTLGPDGVRRNADGQRLSLELMAAAGDRTLETLQQVIQDMWKRIGVEARLRNVTARVYFGEVLRRRQFEALAMFTWISAPNDIPETVLQSVYIPSEANSWGGQNYGGYNSPAMDRILTDLEKTCEPEPRMALWRELQDLYAEDLPAMPLWFRATPFIKPKWLQGVVPTGHQYQSTQRVENWYRGE